MAHSTADKSKVSTGKNYNPSLSIQLGAREINQVLRTWDLISVPKSPEASTRIAGCFANKILATTNDSKAACFYDSNLAPLVRDILQDVNEWLPLDIDTVLSYIQPLWLHRQAIVNSQVFPWNYYSNIYDFLPDPKAEYVIELLNNKVTKVTKQQHDIYRFVLKAEGIYNDKEILTLAGELLSVIGKSAYFTGSTASERNNIISIALAGMTSWVILDMGYTLNSGEIFLASIGSEITRVIALLNKVTVLNVPIICELALDFAKHRVTPLAYDYRDIEGFNCDINAVLKRMEGLC